jgi:hypothetical protein
VRKYLKSEEIDQRVPGYPQLRTFLIKCEAYKWLLASAESCALLTLRKGSTMDNISQAIDAAQGDLSSRHSFNAPLAPPSSTIRFDLDWDLPSFLKEQNYDPSLENAFERAITITGSDVTAQALSCIDYMRQTWPYSGPLLIRAFQQALASPELFTACKSRP